ncbi:hypothetical protein LCGC14_0466830 [marine sediment metagenome]|uniref:Uncharacterized protein n=1 Tax=marine sediment metagenome TaxID=412755 RepID=A0A0F9VMB4_9ZZZZ
MMARGKVVRIPGGWKLIRTREEEQLDIKDFYAELEAKYHEIITEAQQIAQTDAATPPIIETRLEPDVVETSSRLARKSKPRAIPSVTVPVVMQKEKSWITAPKRNLTKLGLWKQWFTKEFGLELPTLWRRQTPKSWTLDKVLCQIFHAQIGLPERVGNSSELNAIWEIYFSEPWEPHVQVRIPEIPDLPEVADEPVVLTDEIPFGSRIQTGFEILQESYQ